jgi:hypothetical protein
MKKLDTFDIRTMRVQVQFEADVDFELRIIAGEVNRRMRFRMC